MPSSLRGSARRRWQHRKRAGRPTRGAFGVRSRLETSPYLVRGKWYLRLRASTYVYMYAFDERSQSPRLEVLQWTFKAF